MTVLTVSVLMAELLCTQSPAPKLSNKINLFDLSTLKLHARVPKRLYESSVQDIRKAYYCKNWQLP